MPLDLGHDTSRPLPTLRPIAEAGVVTAERWSFDRALEQVVDLVLQDAIGRQLDWVPIALGFDELANLRVGEGRVAAENRAAYGASVAGDHRF